MKITLTTLFLLFFACSFGQMETFRYYQKGLTIIEVGATEKRIYTHQSVPSNFMTHPTYELFKVEPLGGTSINLTEGKKKDRFVEISVETAKELLLMGYDANQALNNSYKLREQFQYAVPERHHGFFYYQRSPYTPTDEPFEYQREQIRLKGAKEYDSLVTAHSNYMIYVSDYIENDDFKSLGSLQFILSQFPGLDNGGSLYHKAILDDVVENDPELYFTYMETIESDRSQYFWLLDKKHTKILKNTKTKSPVKGEIRSFKLKNNLVSAGIVTLAVAVDAAFIGGIVYLITLL